MGRYRQRGTSDIGQWKIAAKGQGGYVGQKEDDRWWQAVLPNDADQSDGKIYKRLLKKMEIFRWQTPQYVPSNAHHIMDFYN